MFLLRNPILSSLTNTFHADMPYYSHGQFHVKQRNTITTTHVDLVIMKLNDNPLVTEKTEKLSKIAGEAKEGL